MQKLVLEGTNRESRGTGPARRIRLTGMVPAVLYGGKGDAVSLAVNAKQVAKILRCEWGATRFSPCSLPAGAKSRPW